MRVYDHLEPLGRPEVDGIDIGEIHVYPKIDGTNARVSLDQNLQLQVGSRKRIITPEDDNAGFAAWAMENAQRLADMIVGIADARGIDPRTLTVYGEWLVPHTLKTYREDAWRKFYVFDVHVEDQGYLHPDLWQHIVDGDGFEVILPLRIMNSPSLEQLVWAMNEHNTFLIEDGQGVGEGIVLKNYGGRTSTAASPGPRWSATSSRSATARPWARRS